MDFPQKHLLALILFLFLTFPGVLKVQLRKNTIKWHFLLSFHVFLQKMS